MGSVVTRSISVSLGVLLSHSITPLFAVICSSELLDITSRSCVRFVCLSGAYPRRGYGQVSSVVSRSISVSLGVLLSHSRTSLSAQWYVQVSYLISLLARVFAVCGCQVSKVLSTICCLFVLVLYVHYCRVVCSTNLFVRSYSLTFKFTCLLSYSLWLVNPFKFKCHVLRHSFPNGFYFCQSVAYVRCLPYEIYSRPPTPYFVTVY